MITANKNKLAFSINLLAALCVVAMLSEAVDARSKIRWLRRGMSVPVPAIIVDGSKLCLQGISITNA
jgi:hypothetical protein